MANPTYEALPNLNKYLTLYEGNGNNRTWPDEWVARQAAIDGAFMTNIDLTGSTEAVERERVVYAQFYKAYTEAHQGYSDNAAILERIGLTPTTPMSMRKLFTAQYNAKIRDKNRGNGQPIRMKTFMAATFLYPFTLLARIIRVVLRTAFFWLSMAVSAYKQSNYGPYMPEEFNLVAEDLKRIGWEWIDLGATLLVPLIAIANTLYPHAINLNWMSRKYLERTDEALAKNKIEEEARDKYNAMKKLEHQAFEKRGNNNTFQVAAQGNNAH